LPPERVVIGRVGKPHGLNGAFVVEAASEDPVRFVVGAELIVNGRAAKVVESKRAGGRRVVRLDRRVERGAALEVERASLAPTEENEFYVADLLGATVVEEGGRELGTVTSVEPYEANDVLQLDSGLALPMVEDCIREVDLERARVVVAPGFVDAG
jgi:16S rRNA processing protein RimM